MWEKNIQPGQHTTSHARAQSIVAASPGNGGVGSSVSSNYHSAYQPTQQHSNVDAMQAENSSPSQAMTVQQQLNPPQSEQAGHGDSSGYYMVQHRPEGEHGASSSSAPTGYSGGAPSHGQTGSPAVLSPISGSGGAGMGQGLTTYPPRRKAIRAAQACDACRARKAKCDEGRPSCGFCKESQVPCVYREVPPPKQDRTLLQILDRLGRVETLLDNLNTRGVSHPLGISPTPQIAPPVPPVQMSPRAPSEVALEVDEQLTIPYQHTTAAHKLLYWPSIRRLIDDVFLKHETYVIDEEQNRGSLRIYGRGEERSGGDPNFEDEDDYVTDQWETSTFEWESARTSASDGSGGLDGRIKPDPYGALDGTEHGRPVLDHQTVQELLNSYLASIHILHPILDKATITRSVFKFADLFGGHSSTAAYHSPSGLGLNVSNTNASDDTGSETSMHSPDSYRKNAASGKRKRSVESLSRGPQSQPGYSPGSGGRPPKQRKIPRTVHSAVVLLVLGLGAVCLHRKPIPGPVPRLRNHRAGPSSYGMSPPSNFRAGSSTSTPTPPYSISTSPGPQSYMRQKRELRNIDVIPGMPYFAYAMSIMGTLAGSNELENVQAGLLAGLYWGQLARVLDSWKWISWACMGCQILIRMKLASERDQLQRDLILRAFWSCLQLESDVLAELDLPPSGISRLEDSMDLPSGISTPSSYTDVRDDDPLMWMYYLAQIALRKLLNRVHTALYKQDKTRLDSPRSLAIARELDYQLDQWKLHLPEPLRWSETDVPSADINAARLRAKYFGARYIIHRPFLYHALHAEPKLPTEQTSPKKPVVPRDIPPSVTPTSLEKNCRKCIGSALQSTTAFHAFEPSSNRPIITNVFGTAHAQFGNLLILQAAYQSPALRSLMPRNGDMLGELLRKTIHWFQTLTPISPPVRKDAVILESVAHKVGFVL